MATTQEVLRHLDTLEAAENERHGNALNRIRRMRGEVETFAATGDRFRLADRAAYIGGLKAEECCDAADCPCKAWDGSNG